MQNTEFYENVIKGYRLSSHLGSGGMGDVYLGIHSGTGHKVAIKILNNPEYEQRFRNEMEALARIQHPNIASFYDIAKVGQKTCLILEYVSGITLHELIRRQGKLNYEQAKGIFQQMLQGVGFVHSNQIIHRDIKPANIKIDDSGQVKILDFGIAKGDFSTPLTQTGEAIGTFQYMSPEQLRGKPDKRSDIWSLGITFYEMLTGYLPFKSEDLYTLKEQIRKGQYTAVTTMNNTVPPHIEKVVARCLKLNPDQRYQSTEALLYDLDNTSSGKTSIFSGNPGPGATTILPPKSFSAHQAEAVNPTPSAANRKTAYQPWYKVALIAAALLLLTGLSWWMFAAEGPIAPNEIRIKIYSVVPGSTISIDGGSRKDMPYIIKGKKGKKVKVDVRAKGRQPKVQELDFTPYPPGKINTTYISPD